MGFLGQSEVVPIRTQHVPQTIETPVTFVPVPGAYLRYVYSRSSDSIANQIEGQDYLCFRHNDQRLSFVVCDGVGSSFCGNLAARILGDALLDWLWSLDIAYLGGAAALQEAATSFLQRYQKQAQYEVEEYEIPDQMPPLIRQALEQQRAYGSEAIFVAARVDHPSAMIPNGLVSLFWMGDTQARVLSEENKPLDIGGSWANANRWSTTEGVKGTMSAWMQELKGVGRIAAFTDGLSLHADDLLNYSDDKLDREIYLGARLPTSDDVALIDVVIRSPHYEGYPDPALPDPNEERPHLKQIWNPTGADTYELQWDWPGASKARFIIQEATNPALSDSRAVDVPAGALSWRPDKDQKPGHYYYRVRAVSRRGTITPWSELRKTKVAYPPPAAPELRLLEGTAVPALDWSGEDDTLEYQLEQSTDPQFEEMQVVFEGRSTSWSVPINTSKPGTYYYRVCASSDGGTGPWSQPVQVDIVLPPPPTPHLAVAHFDQETGSYELRWQPVTGATHYELEEVERESGERQINSLTSSIYQIEEQKTGEYVYRVRACHDFGCSEWSEERLVIVLPARPTEAPELHVESRDKVGIIRLLWTEVPEAAEYAVESSEDGTFRDVQMLGTHVEKELEIPHQGPGVLHFRVCGMNAGGRGPWSNVEQISIAPDAPGWIEATLSPDEKHLSLAWGAVGNRVEYSLEMLTDAGDEQSAVQVYHGPDTQFEMEPPPDAAVFIFRVRSEHSGGISRWQESDPVKLHPPPYSPVLSEPGIDERSKISLRWSQVDDATHYVIEAARDADFNDVLSVIPAEKTQVNFHPPGSGSYWFRVKACHKTGQSKPSNVVKAVARRPAPPHLWSVPPVKVNTSYEVTWKGMPGVVFYEIQESPDKDFTPDKTKTLRIMHPEQKLERPGQPAGKYYYRVKAVDEYSQASLWSDVMAVEIV